MLLRKQFIAHAMQNSVSAHAFFLQAHVHARVVRLLVQLRDPAFRSQLRKNRQIPQSVVRYTLRGGPSTPRIELHDAVQEKYILYILCFKGLQILY